MHDLQDDEVAADPLSRVRSLVAGVDPQRFLRVSGLALLLVLSFANLTRYPLTWFDEGSHLHVPKTLVTYGAYADYSDGELRYYGPAVGVGPTVMLPVAAMLRLFGVGLFQARMVAALYLVLAVLACWRLARHLGGAPTAILATLVLVGSPTIEMFKFGRMVMGEVPGLFFLLGGLGVWFAAWERDTRRLWLAGILLGLAAVTKHVYLLTILPGIVAGGVANALYYRTAPHRVFLIPLLSVLGAFGAWQLVLVAGLGPGTATENLQLMQEAMRGAAAAFPPGGLQRAWTEFLGDRSTFGLLGPALVYTAVRQLRRDDRELQWSVVWWMTVGNLGWYALASIGWTRYKFPGLCLASLLVGRLAWDLVALTPAAGILKRPWRLPSPQSTLGAATAAWIVLASAGSLAWTAVKVFRPPFPAPQAMAAYLDEHVPRDKVIHSWEAELGFLTNHRIRMPPQRLQIDAAAQLTAGGPAISSLYDFTTDGNPDYVVEGDNALGIRLYPVERLEAAAFDRVTTIGHYTLYARRGVEGTEPGRAVSHRSAINP